MEHDMGLNITQQIFTLFFAIAWGTAANSQPRWGAFAYANICGLEGGKVFRRILLSWIILNIAPICYFVLVLGSLNNASWNNLKLYPWSACMYWRLVLVIITAFAPFGFYKLWMGLVQVSSKHLFSLQEIVKLNDLPQHKGEAFNGGIVNMFSGLIMVLVFSLMIYVLQ
ncbi:MAG: hypothetical protein WC209_01755 [Ignavibacteriaceae bacterium]|jgi:hypothetical protein